MITIIVELGLNDNKIRLDYKKYRILRLPEAARSIKREFENSENFHRKYDRNRDERKIRLRAKSLYTRPVVSYLYLVKCSTCTFGPT